ncbi:MAG: glycosyl hydrolase family 18 protein [Flavisolibacter sp.]
MKSSSFFSKSILLVLLIVLNENSVAQFRVVGYIHYEKNLPELNSILFDKLTHLNIAFINPDANGELVSLSGIDSLISEAHRKNVKVLGSIGGGSHNPYYTSLLKKEKLKSFVDKLVQYCIDHDLDGLDVDLENEAIDENYEKFVVRLSRKLKRHGKLISAALATWNAQKISKKALKKYDFVNIMSYDQTGPWRPQQPGPHSTITKAEEDLNYWSNNRNMDSKKFNLGLPFYGYAFGTKYGESMSFREIVKTFPGSENKDEIMPDSGGSIYYNGLPTIREKTKLALQKAGGVMIWQILQDDAGRFSLLKEIQKTISAK